MLKYKIKKFNIDFIKDNKGVTALLMTVLVLTSILSVTLSVSAIVRKGISMNWEQVHSVKAFFASEGGMERILYETRKDDILDFSDMSDNDCIRFDAFYDIITNGTHILGDNACFGAGEGDKIVVFSNNANYRIQYEENIGGFKEVILTSYGIYEDQNRVIKSSYGVPLCEGATTNVKLSCIGFSPANSHDSLKYCVVGYCHECDYGYENCDGNVGTGCETQMGSNTNCSFCGDICDFANGSACQSYEDGCS